MEHKAIIKEIFTSIQGEGPYIGVKQLFVRFCGCNLKCDYCDTKEASRLYEDADTLEMAPNELLEQVNDFDLKTFHSISITGGEPLLWADFLEEFLPLLNSKIYLETNATLSTNLKQIVDFVDIIAADIKLSSATGVENSFALHDEFFKMAMPYNKEIFAKVVFDENILSDEISNCIKLVGKYNMPLILQPKMDGNELSTSKEKIFEVFNMFLAKHPNTRVIPQVHKFLRIL